jgi:hypothetical protein
MDASDIVASVLTCVHSEARFSCVGSNIQQYISITDVIKTLVYPQPKSKGLVQHTVGLGILVDVYSSSLFATWWK